MKKLLILTILMLFVSMSFAQRLYYGDKSEVKTKASLKHFDSQIKTYGEAVLDLKKENVRLLRQFEKSKNATTIEMATKMINENDSLIANYREKINIAEQSKEEVLAEVAGKSKVAYVSSIGNSPQEMLAAANAYQTMVYADAYANKVANGAETTSSSSGMIGLVTNKWYKDVKVVVTGPAGFEKKFWLNKNGGSRQFDLAGPGRYVAIFECYSPSGGTERSMTDDIVSLNPNREVYGPDGKKYDFSATLPRGN